MGFAGNGVSHLRELRKTLTRAFFLVYVRQVEVEERLAAGAPPPPEEREPDVTSG